jgi:hypothetical protein
LILPTCKQQLGSFNGHLHLRRDPDHHPVHATIFVRPLEFGRQLRGFSIGPQLLHTALLLQLHPSLLLHVLL